MRGFSFLPLVVFLSIVVFALGYFLYQHYKKIETQAERPDTVRVETQIVEVEKVVPVTLPPEPLVSWQFNGEAWQPSATPSACPNPLALLSPVNTELATKILYPGQYRNENYKPHGGFVFDGQKNADVTVTAPLDATLISGSRYIEDGEVQYMLWFEHPCGLAYRFDHLLTLDPAVQKLVDTLPEAKVNDSRTIRFATPLTVKAGETIATAVGFKKNSNISLDFGVYDLRKVNSAAQKNEFATKHKLEKEQAYYGICWFDLLPAEASRKVRALPAGVEGKGSDYCGSN